MSWPNLFLVGAPKCGTSAMTTYLASHPHVTAPARKDLHPYGRDLAFTHPRPDRAALERHYAGATTPWLLDSSIWHLMSTTAASELRAEVPDARVLVLLRDPVEAMVAHWGQLRVNANGHEDLDFAAALAAEPDRAAGRRVPPGMPLPQALLYRQVVAFGTQLQRYVGAFPAHQRCVVLQEELLADTRGQLARVGAWLGIDGLEDVPTPRVNRARAVRSEGVRAALRRIPEGWKAALPRRIRVALRDGVKALNTVERPRPPVAASLRASLRAELLPEVVRVEALLGRPLRAPDGPWYRPLPPESP